MLYGTGLGLAVTDRSQCITSWLLPGKMVSFLDFTLQILIFPYCYHGNKWRVKAAGNKKPLLHNGVWSFLHIEKQAVTAGLCCSAAVSPRVPQDQDRAHLCQRAAHGKLLACLKQWGCAAVQHQLCHTQPKRMGLSHQAVLQGRVDISSLSGFSCPPPHSQGNSVKTNRG